jgi:glycine cleavage system aminomethyltransferase T
MSEKINRAPSLPPLRAPTRVVAPAPSSSTLYFGPWYRKSPYFEATLRHGCTAYDIYNHMYLPSYYHDPVEEYWHLLKHVTIWDVSVERIVEITGHDAFSFTNMLTCRDLGRCAVGQCKYAPIIDENGGIINDPVLLRLGDKHFWLALADSDVLLWAKGVAIHSGLNVEIKEPDVSPIQVQGPDSKAVMEELFGGGLRGLKYYFCAETKLGDIPVVVSRTGWTAEVGYEIYLRDGSRGDELWERVMEAGKPFGIMPIAPCEARRIEAGIFNYGSDMRLENNPFEVTGLERLVELDAAHDFIGRKALERIQADGVKRKLVGVELSGDALAAELVSYWPVFHDGKLVGHVTDAIHSPRLERNIGYAWVPIELAQPGTEVEARAPGGTLRARVASLPFIDPKKAIPQG